MKYAESRFYIFEFTIQEQSGYSGHMVPLVSGYIARLSKNNIKAYLILTLS